MKSLLTAILFFVCVGVLKPAQAADPTGAWKSTITFHNQQLENSLNLRLDTEGPTLSGGYRDALSQGEVPIANASFKKRDIGFTVTREMSGQKFLLKYQGVMNGDTITGKCTVDYGDRTQTTDWIATRQK